MVKTMDLEQFQKELFHKVCNSAIQCFKDAHHRMCNEATELLAFVRNDSKRIPIPGIPCHLPIAYALKGNSLQIQTMQQMIEHLRDHCDNFNIGVLCEIYEGQFLNLILRGESGQPLTKIKFMKNIYNECKKLSKEQLLTFLLHYSSENPKQLSNIITPRNKLNMYLEYLFNVLEEELSGENNGRGHNCGTNVGTLENDDLDVLLCGSQLG